MRPSSFRERSVGVTLFSCDFPDEHGRGQFSIGDQMFVWKIDWTADPTGIVIPESERPETFFHVLTIMCAEEE